MSSKYLFFNNKDTTLTASLSNVATTLPVSSLASDIINHEIVANEVVKVTFSDTSGNIEVVDVEGSTGTGPITSYTIGRGAEVTSAATWPIGTKVSLRLTSQALNSFARNLSQDSFNMGIIANDYKIQTGIVNATARANSSSVTDGDIKIDSAGTTALLYVSSGTTAATESFTTFSTSTTIKKDGTALFIPIAINSTTRVITNNGDFIGDDCVSKSGSFSIGSGSAIDNGLAIGSVSLEGFGRVCTGQSSIAIQGSAIADNSLAIGGYAPVLGSLSMPYIPLKPQELFLYFTQTNLECVIWSQPMDLTGGVTWASSAAIAHGYVVKPTVGNGFQYIREDNTNYKGTNKFAGITYTPSNIGSTQPTWPTTDNATVSDGGGGTFYAVSNVGHSVPIDADFMVLQVGFIVYDAASVTVQPFISVGISGNNTKFVANTQTTGLTAAGDVQLFTTSPGLASTLTVSLNTVATGTRLLGQFFIRGFYAPSWF